MSTGYVPYGTSDAWYPPIPSGKWLNPGNTGYSGSYNNHMQQIISAVIGAGKFSVRSGGGIANDE